MQLLYTIDIYCNAALQMLVDCLRAVGIHVVWLRIILGVELLYLFAASIVVAKVHLDSSMLALTCLGVSAMFVYLLHVTYDASHVFFGNTERVDTEREDVVDRIYASGVTIVRPLLVSALTCFVVTIPELGEAARLFAYSATCFIALLYLETCS